MTTLTRNNLGRISFTKRDRESITQELQDLVTQTRPGLQSDFFAASLGAMLIDLNAWIGDLISFGQDTVGLEVFLATARRYESALRFARSIGFAPRLATAAEVTVRAVSLPDQIVSGGPTLLATIAKGSKITGANGLSYELLEDVVIVGGTTVSTLQLFEGESFTDFFEASSKLNQEIITENGPVAESTLKIFVGDPNIPSNEYTSVLNVALETTASQTYQPVVLGDGRITARFGNGINGKIPDDDITAEYRTTSGAVGNTPVFSIRGSVQATLNLPPDTTVSITYENSDEPAAGGADRESIEELRVNIPAFIRAVDKVISLLDYDTNITRVTGVALGFADLSVSSFNGNTILMNVWDEEEVDFTSESPITQSPATSVTKYKRFSEVPDSRVDDIQAFLRERSLETVQSVIQRPTIASVDIYIRELSVDARFDVTVVHQGVTDAVVAVFEAATGFAIRISALYDAIRDVPGVTHFTLDRIVFERLKATEATGSITFTGAVQPLDGDSVTISDGGLFTTFEFDNNGSVGGGSIPVPIGLTLDATIQTLIDLINANLNITADRDTTTADPTISLIQRSPGDDFNLTITFTGAFAVTGMENGSDTLVVTLEDHRRIQDPVVDQYPPGLYIPGAPFIAGGAPWEEGGILPYLEIEDLVISEGLAVRKFYDETFLYNNEILYNGGQGLQTGVQAINLRRLVFEPTTV